MKQPKDIKLPQFDKNKALKLVLLVVVVALIGLTVYFAVLAQRRAREITDLLATEVAESSASIVAEPKVVIFGDSRTGHDIHTAIVDEIYKLNPVAVFHVGDAVENGEDASQWQVFNNIESKLIDNFNFYIAGGNHDRESALYYNNFSLPGNEKWYSVNYLGIHWVVLNSNVDLMPGSEQYVWLEQDLAKTRAKIDFVAVLIHQSLVTSALHSQDSVPYKVPLMALLKNYGVDVVFSGHDHTYERSLKDGIYYLICGSAGAPLYDQAYPNPDSQKFVKSYNYCVVQDDNGAFSLKAYNERSEEIDSLTFLATD